MNQKAYSVFLCALLASTFVHDFNVKAQNALPVSRIPSNCHWELKCTPTTITTSTTTETPSPTTETSPPTTETSPPTTETSPPTTETHESPTTEAAVITKGPVDISDGLHIFANLEFSLLITLNKTAKVAYVVDAEANLIALFSGESQSGIIINLSSGAGISFTKKDNVIKGGDFVQYLKSLKGLKVLFEIKGAIKFQVSSASKDIQNAVNALVVKVIPRLQSEFKTNPKVGLQIIVALGSQLVKLIKGDLNGILKVLGTAGYTGHEDLVALVICWVALGGVIKQLGGIAVLKKAGVKLDWQALAYGGDGINIFAIFILSIGSKVDIAKALGELLNNPASALKLIAQLDGNSNKGVNGVIKLFENLVGFIKKQVAIEVVINVVIQFLAVNKGASKEVIVAQFKKSINALLDALNKAKASAGLKGFVDLLTKLRDGKLVIDNVNVSAIVDHILDGLKNPNPLVIVVGVLVRLGSVVAIEESAPILILVLILNVNSPLGLNLLQGLGLLLNFAIGGIVGGILGFLFGSLQGIISLLFGGILAVLKAVPSIGQLLGAIQVAFSGAGVKKDLNALLGKGGSDLLKALVQSTSGIKLGASSEAVQKVKEVQKNSASVSSYLNVNFEFSAEVSSA